VLWRLSTITRPTTTTTDDGPTAPWHCLTSSYFQYIGKRYKQLRGMALGSTVCAVPLWLRYLHDTITAVHKNKINEFHEHLNNHNTSIHFTKEIEGNGKIPFLDCSVTRENNTLRFTVYRKPTHNLQSYFTQSEEKNTNCLQFDRRSQALENCFYNK